MITPGQLAACLNGLGPVRLQAVELLDQITLIEADDAFKLDVASVLALSPDIEAALHQAERIAAGSQRIVKQCLQLTPIPHPKVPLGF